LAADTGLKTAKQTILYYLQAIFMPRLLLLCCFVPTLFHSVLDAADNTGQRPNIVFLMADDQCTYSMGCYGNQDVQTPNLDQLAAEGMVFDNHYDTTAICMASRANVMTGMYEYKTGCNFDHGPLVNDLWQTSYPMQLRKAGYFTGFAGKFGFEVVDTAGEKKGRLPSDDFDLWGGGPGQTSYKTSQNKSMAEYADQYPHSTLSYGAFGRDFIQQAAATKKPFCLSISFKAPHQPTTPDPRFDSVYQGKTFQKPANYGRRYGLHFAEQSRTGRQYERFFSWNYADQYDQVMATYNQQIYGIDVAVGMIRDALKEHGVADNTVVIYTSDNGFLCGSHGYGSKVLPYEEASRVPLIVLDQRHTNSGRKTRCEALTGNVDFAPTILKLAGLKPTATMDGGDLMTLYDQPDRKIHDSLQLINVWGPADAHSFAVVTKDMKYIYWPSARKGMTPTEEFYNTSEDPLELTNLIPVTKIPPPDQPKTKHDVFQALEQMRSLYDQAVAQWKREAVAHNNYTAFGTISDRSIAWEEKANLGRYSKAQAVPANEPSKASIRKAKRRQQSAK